MDSKKKFIAGKVEAKVLVLNDFYTQRNPDSKFQTEVSK